LVFGTSNEPFKTSWTFFFVIGGGDFIRHVQAVLTCCTGMARLRLGTVVLYQ